MRSVYEPNKPLFSVRRRQQRRRFAAIADFAYRRPAVLWPNHKF